MLHFWWNYILIFICQMNFNKLVHACWREKYEMVSVIGLIQTSHMRFNPCTCTFFSVLVYISIVNVKAKLVKKTLSLYSYAFWLVLGQMISVVSVQPTLFHFFISLQHAFQNNEFFLIFYTSYYLSNDAFC